MPTMEVEKITAALDQMKMPIPTPIHQVLADLERERTELTSSGWPEDVQKVQRAKLDDKARRALTAAFDQVDADDAELKRLAALEQQPSAFLSDDEAATARAFPEYKKQLEARMRDAQADALAPFLNALTHLTDAGLLLARYEDIEAKGNPEATRFAGSIVLDKLKAQATAAGPGSEAARTWTAFLTRVQTWEQAHPSTPTQRRAAAAFATARKDWLARRRAHVLKFAGLR